mmetsp:Transcript_2470/g.7761  ORF Transcript_2470/g.7761 Transcript_2470/m.7761 type:complete len:269 (+) Transcript_2470:52-858(+)
MSLDVFTFMILLRRASCPPASFFLVVLSYWSSPTMNCCQFRESKFEGSTCKTNHLLLFPRPPAMADIQSLPSLQQLLLFLGNLYPVLRPCLQDLQDLFGRLVDLQDVSQRHLVSQLQGLAASEDTCQHLSTLVDTCRAVPHRRHDVLGSLQQSVVVDVDFCFVVLPHPPSGWCLSCFAVPYVFKPWYDWKCRSWFQFLSVAILCCLPSLSSRVSIFDLLILDRLLLDISRFLLLLPSLLPLPRPAANARLFHLHDSLMPSNDQRVGKA